MKFVKYLLSNNKIYIRSVLYSVLIIIISLIFYKSYFSIHSINQMLNQSSCTFIAYDDWTTESDSYAFYGNNIDVYNKDDESLLNVSVAQFIENTSYSCYSFVNKKNTIEGNYSILNEGEIALPYSFKQKYNFKINSCLFVDGLKCNVKYFFRDIYQVHSINTSIAEQTIFVGKKTINKKITQYLKFYPDSDVKHTKMYSVENNLRKPFRSQENKIVLLQIIIYYIISLIFLGLLKENKLIKTFLLLRINGEKTLILKLWLFELIYVIIPFLILYFISFWNKLSLFLFVWICALIFSFITMVIINMIYLERRKSNEFK